MSNTLLSYFKKVDTPDRKPKVVQKIKDENDKENQNEIISIKDESDDEPVVKRKSTALDTPKSANKRKRAVIHSDSDASEDEKEVLKTPKSKTVKKTRLSSPIEDEEMEEDADEDEKPVNKKHQKIKEIQTFSPKSTPNAKKKPAASGTPSAKKVNLEEFAADGDNEPCDPADLLEGRMKHLSYTFLHDGEIKDINMRPKSDPDYDSRTLYVPENFKNGITPAMRQWWELKETNFDVLLFFKVGKFYELYHQDAVIAIKELGLTLMRGDYAHCGFPEIAFTRYADALVSKGYKVGRVEQTETPDMMAERLKTQKKVTKFDKTVKREVCRITTPGTKTPNILDNEFASSTNNYLFSIIEKIQNVQEKMTRVFGVCFVDTVVGKIHIGQFEDDRHCSKLRTALAKFAPAHIMTEKNLLSKETKQILDHQNSLVESLANDQMIDASKLLRALSESAYFKTTTDGFKWPETIKSMLSESKSF